ncbi:hypothetical protein [Methylobacterium aerolatum]|uniref:Cysteine-rich CPCC domain-containing protein n=1 Tax=Methylobacterium aerolatum TaxID=418708 RepID=A0ABU0I2B8_9HYPH|nr:hypothetical protein [Methylobacterium aerolatum]MDQ0448257.1 hypothetical protein [Methylobacterium aerolatum]GJD35740.1 hypothetical protein FMGBMHLM_2652 [Methylobacterium aerolatum]
MTGDDVPGASTPVTFRGRGLGLRLGSRLVVLVCPLCSQRNAPRGAERGICEWCAYVPSPEDVEQVEDA